MHPFFMEMANNDEQNFAYLGLDNRAILNALNGVNYFSLRYNTPEERALVPSGYAPVYEKYNFAIFENTNALPLGYGSAKTLSKARFDELSPLQRQEALLYGTVVEGADKTTSLSEAEPVLTSETINYEITDAQGVELTGSGLIADGGGTITLSFEGLEGSETYLFFKNLHVDSGQEVSSIIVSASLSDGTVVTNTLNYKSESSQYYSGWHDFLINLGASKEAKNQMTVTFPVGGKYSFDEMSVCCQPLYNVDSRLSDLGKDVLRNVNLHKNPISYATGKVSGEFDASQDELLVINIPYSKGFTAYIDGVKRDIIKANIMFMAVPVTEGCHEVVLKYATPGLGAGIIISLIGFIIFFLFAGRRMYDRSGRCNSI